jgi:hypothetical protein
LDWVLERLNIGIALIKNMWAGHGHRCKVKCMSDKNITAKHNTSQIGHRLNQLTQRDEVVTCYQPSVNHG